MAVKTFSVSEVLTASDTNSYLANSGYVYIGKTTFSTVASASISNVFSSTYDRYLVVARITGSNTGQYVYLRYKLGSTEYATGNYYKYGYFIKWNSTLTTYANGGETNFSPLAVFNGAHNESRLEIQNPYSSSYRTSHTMNTNDVNDGACYVMDGVVGATNSFDGFNLYASTGTMSGEVLIYGMRQP
jgi:hypothetical protein